MATLKETLTSQIPGLRAEAKSIVKEHGDKVIAEVTVKQLFGGMRGIKCLICDTSFVDPMQGLIIRGTPISQLVDRLPEEIFFLLCTGELPDAAALKDLQGELNERAAVPDYVWKLLRKFMTSFQRI